MGRRTLFLLGFVLVGSTVFAASDTWNGTAADNDWLTTTNWVGGTVPGAGDTATFNGTAPGGNVSTNTPTNLAAIDVLDPHANSITLSQNLTLSGNLTMTSTSALAILNMANRTLTVGGNVNVQGNSSVVSGGTGSLVFTGSNATWRDTSGGTSTWHNVTINAGAVVRITNGSNITVNDLTINAGAELILSGGSTITVGGTQSGTVLRELVWIGGNQDHNNNNRWSPNIQPGNTDIAVFNGSGTGSCRVQADVTWYRAELRTGAANLRIRTDRTLTLVDDMIVTAATLDLLEGGAATNTGNVSIGGDMTVNGGTVAMSTGETMTDANVSIQLAGNLNFTSGTWTKNATGRLRFNGTGQTWTGAGATDWGNVIVAGTDGSAVTATNAIDVDDLTINSGGLTMGAANLLTVDGDLSIGDNTGAASTADLTGNTGGVTLAGSLTMDTTDGDYTPGGGTFTFTGTGQTWDADGETMGAVVINAGGTITLTNTDTTTTTLTLTAGTLSAGSRILTATGAIAINGGTLDAGSGTINANAAVAINNGTLDTNTGSVVAASTTAIGDAAGGVGTAILDNSAGTFEARNNLTVNTDGNYIQGGSLSFTTNPATWTNNVAGENFGNVTINTGGTDTVTTAGSFTVGTLTMVSGELDVVAASTVSSTQVLDTGAQAGMTLTVNGTLNVDSANNNEGLIWSQATNATNLAVGTTGQLLVDREIYFSSSAGGSFTVTGGGQISIGDDFRYNTNTPLTQSGTITLTGATTANMELRNDSGNNALNFGNVVINGSGVPFQPNNPGGGPVLVTNLTLTAGDLDFDTFDDTLEITGNTNLTGLGTFTASGTGGVTELRFSGTGVTLTDGAQTDNLDTVEITGSVTLNSTILVTALTVNGGGASLTTGANTIQATGATDIRSGGTINGNGGTVDLDGAVSAGAGTGTISMGSGALQFGNGSVNLSSIAVSQNAAATTTFNVNGVVTLMLGGGNDQFGNLTLANGGNNVNVSGGNMDVDGTLTIGTNTLAIGTTTVLLAGALDASNSTGDITGSAGGGFTFNSVAAGVQTVTLNNETTGMNLGTVLVTRGAAARTVSIVGSGGTGDNFQARGVTVTTGTLDLQISTIIDGSTTAPSVTLSNANSTFQTSTNDSLQLEFLSENAGSIGVLINGGTFSVTDAGAGGTNTVIFDEGDTVDLNTGTFRIRGASGELTTLRDDTAMAGGRWTLDSQGGGTVDLAFLTLSDGDANPNQQIVVGGTDGGNNVADAFVFGTVWLGTIDNQWDLNTNWSGDVLPSGTIPAIFNGSSNGANQPTMDSANLPTIAGLLFQSTYIGNAVTATIDGGLTVNGSFSFQAGAGGDLSIANLQTLTLNGTALTVNSAAAAISGAGSVTFSGGAQQNLTIANGTSLPAVVVQTASTDLRPSANTLTLTSLTVNAGATMNLAANDPTLSVGAVTLNGTGALTADAGTLTVTGNWSSGSGLALTVAHTTIFNNAGGTVSVGTGAFRNVTVQSNLTHSTGAWAVTGNLLVSAGTLSSSAGLTVTGTTRVNSALTFTAGTSALNGNWLTASTGTLTAQGTAALTLDGTSLNFSNSDINSGGTASFTLGTTDGKTLTVTAADGLQNLTVNGSTTVSGTLSVTGTLTLADNFTFGTGGGTVTGTVSGSAGQLTLDGTVGVGGNFNLSNLTLSAGTGTDRLNLTGATPVITPNGQTFNRLGIATTGVTTVAAGQAIAANGTLFLSNTGGLTLQSAANTIGGLNMTAGTPVFTLAGTNLVCGGAWAQTVGTFTPGTTRVDLNAGGASTIQAIGTFGGGLRVTGAGTYVATGNILVAGATLDLAAAGGLTLANGTANTAGSISLLSTGNLTGNNGTLTVTGTWTSAANNFVNGGMLVVLSGGVQSITQSTGNPFQNLTLNTAAGIRTFVSALDVDGNLFVDVGTAALPAGTQVVDGNVTVDAGGALTLTAASTLQVGGSWNLTGGSITIPAATTVELIGGGNVSVNQGTLPANAFVNFRMNKSAGSAAMTGVLDVNGQLDVDGQTLTIAAVGADVSGMIDVQGGTLAGTGTVIARLNVAVGSGAFTAAGLSFQGVVAQTLTDGTAAPGQNYGALTVNNGNSGVTLVAGSDVQANTVTLTNGSLTLAGNQLSLVGATLTPISITVGTLDGDTGTIRYAGSIAGSINVETTGVTYQNVIFDQAGQTFLPDGNLTLTTNGSFTVSNGTFNASTFTITVPGGFSISGGAGFTAGTSTVILNGALAQAYDNGASTLNILRVNKGAQTATVTGTLRAATLDIDAGELALSTSGAVIGAGGLDQDGGTLTANAGASAITCSGNWDIAAGTFTANASTVTLLLGNAQAVIQNGQAFNNLTINKTAATTATLTGALDVNGSLTMTGGNLTVAAAGGDVDGNVSVSAGTLTGGAGTLTVGADFDITGTGAFTNGGGTVVMDGQTNGSPSLDPGGAFATLTVNVGGTVTATALLSITTLNVNGGSLDLGGGGTSTVGTLSVAGTLDTNGANSLNVTGNATVSGTLDVDASATVDLQGGTLTTTGGTINLNGTGRLEIRAAVVNLGALTGFTAAAGSLLVLDGAATHTLTLGAGQTFGRLQTDRSVNVASNPLVTAGTVTINLGTLALGVTGAQLGGAVSGAGTLSAAGAVNVRVDAGFTATGFTAGTGTLTFNGTGFWNGNANTFGNVAITAGTITTQSNIALSGDLTVSAGTLQLSTNTNNISVAGASTTVNLTGGTWTQLAANTLTFNGTGTQVLIGGGNTIGSLVVSTSDVNITTSNLTVAGTTTVAATRTLAVASSVTQMIFGTSNAAASLVSLSGILSLDADTTFSGNLTVNSGGSFQGLLNPITIRFGDTTGSSVTTVAAGGTIQVNPTVAGQTNLFSENDGVQWSLNLAANVETFADIRVRDSNANAGTPANSSAVDSDLLNNLNWPDLDAQIAEWDGSQNSDWNQNNNWVGGAAGKPIEGSTVRIQATAPNLPLTNWSNLKSGQSITNLGGFDILVATGTIRFSGATMSVSTTLAIPGTVVFDAQDDLTVTGQISGTGTLDCDTAANVNVIAGGLSTTTFVKPTGAGDLTLTGGTWSGASDFGTVTLTTAAPTTGSSLNMDVLTITGVTLTPAATHNITVDAGAISGTGGLNMFNNGNVTVSGGLTVTTFTRGNGLLTLNGTGTLSSNPGAGGFGQVAITGNGTQVSLGIAALVNNGNPALQVTGSGAGARLRLNGFGLTVTGNMTLGNGAGNDGDLEANTGAAVVSVSGNLIFQDASTVITPTNLTTTFTGAGPHTLTLPNPTASLGNLPVNAGVTVVAAGGSGTLRTEALTINATGTLTATTVSVQANGSVDLTGGFTINAAGTFTFGKTGAAVVTETFNPGGKTLPDVVVTGANKVLNQNASSLTINGTTTISAGADLQVSAGTANFANDGTGTVTVTGAGSVLRTTANTNFQDGVVVTAGGTFNAPEGGGQFTIEFSTTAATALSVATGSTITIGTAGGLAVDVILRPYLNALSAWTIDVNAGATQNIRDVGVRFSTVAGTSANLNVQGGNGVDQGNNTLNPPTNPGWQNLNAVNPTWTGAISTDWAVDGNWTSPATAPSAGSTVTFTGTPVRDPALNQPTNLAGLITTSSFTRTVALQAQLNLSTLSHSAGTLNLNGQILTVNGAVTLNTGVADTNGAGSLRFIGGGQALTIGAGGVAIQALTNIGFGTATTVTSSGGRLNVEALTVAGTSTYNTGGIAVLVSQTTTVSATGTLVGGASTFTLAGNVTTTGATAVNFGTGVTTITGASTMDLANTTFGGNLTTTPGAGNTVLINSGALDVDGGLTVGNGTFTFNAAGSNIDQGFAVSAGATANAAGTILNGGFFNMTGTFNAGTSTVTFDNGALAQIFNGGAQAFNNVNFTGANVTMNTGQLDVNGNLSLTSNTLTLLAGQGADIEGTLTVNGGTLNFNTANVTVAGATVNFTGGAISGATGASTLTLDGGAQAFTPNSLTFNSVTVGTGSTTTLQANPITVAGILTVTGTLAQNGQQITLTGTSATPMLGTGTFTGNGLVLYNTTGTPAGGYILPALGFQNVTVAQASRIYQNDAAINITGTLTVNNTVTYRLDNTLTAGSVTGAGTPVINLNSQTLRLSGGAPFGGTALANLTNVLTSTIDYAGGGAQAVPTLTHGNVILSNGSTYTGFAGTLNVTRNLTFTNGASVNGANLSFSGTVASSTFNCGGSTVTIGTLTVNKLEFAQNGALGSASEFRITGSSGTRVVNTLALTSGLMNVTANLTIGQGTVGQAGDPGTAGFEAQLRVQTNSVNLTVGTAGQTRVITINDSVQIGFGASSVINTMASGAGTTTTYTLAESRAELRFQGASGNNVQLLTSASGQSAFITGPATVDTGRGASGLFASVRDNNASGYAAGQIQASSSIDLGNNVNWNFVGGGNITALRATALGDGNGRIDRVQVMFGGTPGLQSSTLGTVHQQFVLVQTDGSGNDLQSITGTASAIASTPSNRGLTVTFGAGLGKTDVTNVELRYTAPSSGFLTNTGGVPASISFTLTAAAGTLQDGAPPVLISSFFQDLDANDGLDRGSFFFSEPPAFKAGCGLSISGWNPVTNTSQMGGSTLLTLQIAGETLAAFDVASAPFTTGAQIASEIQTRVRNLITNEPPAGTNTSGPHNPLNRPAYRNFTATFDGQRYIFKAGVPLGFNSTTGEYFQDYARSTVNVITGGANDVSANLGMAPANGGVERAGRGNARRGMSVSRSIAASGATPATLNGNLNLQMNGETSRSYSIAGGSASTSQVAALIETAVRATVNSSTLDPDSVANADAYNKFVCVPDTANGGRLILISGQQGSGSSVVVDSLSAFATVAALGSQSFTGGAAERAGQSNTQVFIEPLSIRLGDGSNPILGKGNGDLLISGNVLTVDLTNVANSGLATPVFQWTNDGSGVFFSDAAAVPNASSNTLGNLTGSSVVVITGDSDGDLSVSRSPGAQVVDASSSLPPLGNSGASTDFSWAWVSGPSDPLSGGTFNGPALSFSATTAGSYVFRLTITVVDGSGNPVVTAFSDAQGRLIRDVTVVITEDKPIASAGADLTLVSTNLQVQLDGTGSFDPNGGAIAYVWSAVNTATNTLVTPSPFDDDTISQPTFTAPSSGRYTITLTVRKVNLETSQGTDTATITITDPSSLFPVADAGADQVGRINTQITLNGNASSHPASSPQALTYAWSIISSPEPVTLSDAAVVGPTFTPTTPGSYVFGLVVQTTGLLTSQTDQVTIQVIDDQATSPRIPPAAVALVAGLRRGVFLSGGAPAFNLNQPPVFVFRDGLERDVTVIDLAGNPGDDPLSSAVIGFHKVEVMVGGSLFATLYAPQVTGDAQVVQLRPIKGETPIENVQAYGVSGTSFVLDASNSQDDGVISTATWTQVSGPFQFASQTGSLLAVVPQSAGTYVFDLVVTDNIGLSSFSSRVVVPVIPANLTLPAGPPSAAASVAGGQTVTIEGVVTFVAGQNQAVSLTAAGSVSRVTGTPQTGAGLFTYLWTQLVGPTAVLAANNTEVVSAQLLVPGGYLFQVQVTDTNGVSSFGQVWISVGTSVANALVAAIATLQDLTLPTDGNGVTVTFDASQSQGAGPGVTYLWSQTAGSPVFIGLTPGTGGEQGTAVITQPGTYTFTVRVYDGTTTSAPQTISFKVSAPAETPLSSGASLKESSGGCALVPSGQPRGAGAWLFLALGLMLLVLRGRGGVSR